jgi:LysM repeat protein
MAVRPARYLAPIALAATIAGTYAIVHDAMKSKKHSTTSHSVTSTATGTSGSTKHKPQKTTYYVVKSGDNLTAIAAKTGVSVTAIEALNRNLDPNALQTGQRLRLRR